MPHVSDFLNAGLSQHFYRPGCERGFIQNAELYVQLLFTHHYSQTPSFLGIITNLLFLLVSLHTLRVMIMLVVMKAVRLVVFGVSMGFVLCPVCRRPLQATSPHYEAV